ncbi:MAG: hypothetical protein WDA10_15480, partial [Porticoccaceae bacterium]
GGVESVGHLGEVEIAPYRFPHDAQLLEVHFASFSSVIFCVARYTLHLIAAMLLFTGGKLVGRSRSELARPPATCNLQPATCNLSLSTQKPAVAKAAGAPAGH